MRKGMDEDFFGENQGSEKQEGQIKIQNGPGLATRPVWFELNVVD